MSLAVILRDVALSGLGCQQLSPAGWPPGHHVPCHGESSWSCDPGQLRGAVGSLCSQICSGGIDPLMPVQLLTLWEWAPTTCFLGSLGLSMRHSSISPGTMVSAYMSLDFSIPLTLEVLCAVLLGEGLPS